MNKVIGLLTIALMVSLLVITFPLYLWAMFVQNRFGAGKLGVSVYLAGIVLPVVLIYAMI